MRYDTILYIEKNLICIILLFYHYQGGNLVKKRILIGVIIADCYVDFQEEIMRGIISQSFKSNCDIAVITPFHNFNNGSRHQKTEEKIYDLILSDRFDGFVYDRNTFYGEGVGEHIDDLLTRSGKPVMLLDSAEHKSFETTSIDDCGAFENITDHLIEVHGLKRIYCITGPKKLFVSEERLKGYRNSMKKHNLPCDRNFIRYGDFWKDAAKTFAKEIISGDIERPEAVVCGNDVMAVTLTNELINSGINVPDDIAVTGYDASVESLQSAPSITSYTRPNYQLGAEAFRRLYRIITGKICNKVPNENGGLRLGRSCGCNGDPALKRSADRRNRIDMRYETQMLYGDMLYDITNVDSISELSDRLDNYTYLIYKIGHVRICLTEKYLDSAVGKYDGELDFNINDKMKQILSKSAVTREYEEYESFSADKLLPVYDENRKYPVAYYISPLHHNNRIFGYIGLSFGKEKMAFGTLYIRWVNYVNIALEQVRVKSRLKRTITTTTRAFMYDEVTGLLSRNGFENKVEEYVPDGNCECIRIQLTGIAKTYYHSGEEKCRKILSSFASVVSQNIKDEEICSVWESNSIGIVTRYTNRAGELFSSICESIKASQHSDENCNIDFTVGTCSMAEYGKKSLADIMHTAAVNRLFTYNVSESSAKPQYDKLCLLRNNIMKNPEQAWNISEIADGLFLSKSYLQKIYKTYFGKSIIEEMIQFRIDKAKNFLVQTDMTITDIARECGYSSYNYFVRQFKISEDISPSEYREKHKPN